MKRVPSFERLHGCTDRQAGRVAFAENVRSFVIPYELGIAGALAEQELLLPLWLNDLNPD